MNIIVVLAVGVITGVLGSLFRGGSPFGMARTVLSAIAGAFVASWVRGVLYLPDPNEWDGGAILVAMGGAVGLLLLQQVSGLAWRGGERWTRSVSRSRAWRAVQRSH